jgi:SpoU rRNA methylase family enzyme
MVGTKETSEKIIISNINKIGIVHLQGVEKYLEKHKPKKCFLITTSQPHENVLKHAEHIQQLEIIVSSKFKEEKEKIEKKYKDSEIVTVDPYQLAGRDGMLDGA